MRNADELRQTIDQIAVDAETVAVAVAVRDCETGFEFQHNSARRFHAASTMKVGVLLALLRAIDEGRFEFDDPVHVRNRFRSALDGAPFRLDSESDGYPQLYKLIGRTAKISDLADVMIT